MIKMDASMSKIYSFEDFYKDHHVNLIALFGVIIVIYIVIFMLFNNTTINTPEARPWITIIELFLWILFIVILFINIRHFSNFDYNDVLYNLFGSKKSDLEIHIHNPQLNQSQLPKVNKTDTTPPPAKNTPPPKNKPLPKNKPPLPDPPRPRIPLSTPSDSCSDASGEVFHIPHNRYNYEQAKEACELFDARLATYDEVEDSYKNGANWCSYGWSSDQLALFPIQKSMYNELKKIPGHERDCGRVGVNGGYFEDKNTQFGVNCYGKKPYANEDDLNYMNNFNFGKAFPEAEEKRKERERILNNILIAPFNKEKWNED